MTLRVRNSLLIVGVVVSGLCLALSLISTVVLDGKVLSSISPRALIAGGDRYSGVVALPLLFLCLSLFVLCLVLIITFRKTFSKESLFFFVFLVATGLESVRLLLFHMGTVQLPIEAGMLFSRIVFFGRFWGSISLFSVGLFACGVHHQRTTIILVGGVLASLVLAITIPLDGEQQRATTLYVNGFAKEFIFALMTVELLGVGNLLYAVRHNGNPGYFFLAGGLLLVVIGKMLLFGGAGGYTVGLLVMLLGASIFINRTHRIYMWL